MKPKSDIEYFITMCLMIATPILLNVIVFFYGQIFGTQIRFIFEFACWLWPFFWQKFIMYVKQIKGIQSDLKVLLNTGTEWNTEKL